MISEEKINIMRSNFLGRNVFSWFDPYQWKSISFNMKISCPLQNRSRRFTPTTTGKLAEIEYDNRVAFPQWIERIDKASSSSWKEKEVMACADLEHCLLVFLDSWYWRDRYHVLIDIRWWSGIVTFLIVLIVVAILIFIIIISIFLL